MTGGSPTRREALRRMGLALLGTAVGAGRATPAAGAAHDPSRPLPLQGRVDAAPGQVHGAASRHRGSVPALGPLGIQLYTLRQPMAADVEGTLARVAEIGYEEVELAGLYDRTPTEFRAALDAAGLVAPSTHLGVDAFDEWEPTLDAAETLGHRFVVVPSLPDEMTADADAWRRTAERFDVAGEAARARGIRVAFHNHAGEARPLNGSGGATGLDVFLQSSQPELVGVQADVYWLLEGGLDPVTFFDRWPGRVWSLHVKGRAADGAMVDVGAGVVDWVTVLAAGRRAGAEHLFVEHDRPGDPLASAEASHRHLASLEIP